VKSLIKVLSEDAGQRVDVFISEKTGITRSQVLRLIEKSMVRIVCEPVKAKYKVKKGDVIEVETPEKETEALVPEDLDIDILFSDEHICVVNKPPGMVVHPAAGNRRGTLMNALRSHFKNLANIGGPLRPGVVHRLDKDTSGTIVVALSDPAYYGLIRQFKERSIIKRYLALVYGSPKADKGEISSAIGRSASDRKKMSTRTRHPKEARTSWHTLRRFKDATLISVQLETGRTHQIRVHMASIGHPVLGDKTYGRKTSLPIATRKVRFPRQMLHAELLGFEHPITGEHMEFMSSIPEDMQKALEKLT
jgi:23S rRNA pseudouridine1911/1915/1917 synthase